jgi:hypothetical protein
MRPEAPAPRKPGGHRPRQALDIEWFAMLRARLHSGKGLQETLAALDTSCTLAALDSLCARRAQPARAPRDVQDLRAPTRPTRPPRSCRSTSNPIRDLQGLVRPTKPPRSCRSTSNPISRMEGAVEHKAKLYTLRFIHKLRAPPPTTQIRRRPVHFRHFGFCHIYRCYTLRK